MVVYGSNTSASTWYQWCTSDSTTATAPTANTVIWNGWVASSTTVSITASTDATWYAWNDGVVSRVQVIPYNAPSTETEAQRQARLQREEQYRQEAEARKKEQEEANARANELLESNLSDEQRRQLREIDAIIINLVSRQYRIRRDGAVHELDKDGKPVASYCIHPRENFPPADIMLAKKLMLETDEGAFLRIANKTPIPVAN